MYGLCTEVQLLLTRFDMFISRESFLNKGHTIQNRDILKEM